MAEYKTGVQVNYGFGLSFQASGKAPIIAKQIWATLADAQAYVDSETDTACKGLILTVVNDTTASNNGVYLVTQAAGEDGAEGGRLTKLSDSTDVNAVIADLNSEVESVNSSGGTKVKVTQTNGKITGVTVTQPQGKVEANSPLLVDGGTVKTYVDTAINTAVASTFKPMGCYDTLDELNTRVPVANRKEGHVYNIKSSFVLPDDEKTYPAGTNVVWVGEHKDGSTTHAAHWDALGGTFDLSGYKEKQSVISVTGAKSKTITAISQDENGKISATTADIAIAESQVTGLADKLSDLTNGLSAASQRITTAQTAADAAKTAVTTLDNAALKLGVSNDGHADESTTVKLGTGSFEFHSACYDTTIDEAGISTTGQIILKDQGSENTVELAGEDGELKLQFGGAALGTGVVIHGVEMAENAKATDAANVEFVLTEVRKNSNLLLGDSDTANTIKHAEAVAANALAKATEATSKAGVTSFAGKTGAISIDTDNETKGNVKFTMHEGIDTGNTLQGTVVGLKSAAYTESTAYDKAGAAAAVLGTDKDTATAATVYGAKAAAEAAKQAAAAAQTTANGAVKLGANNEATAETTFTVATGTVGVKVVSTTGTAAGTTSVRGGSITVGKDLDSESVSIYRDTISFENATRSFTLTTDSDGFRISAMDKTSAIVGETTTISGVSDPTQDTQVSNKRYVDSQISEKVAESALTWGSW